MLTYWAVKSFMHLCLPSTHFISVFNLGLILFRALQEISYFLEREVKSEHAKYEAHFM